jgi:beta-N-acetylglucosaminidase
MTDKQELLKKMISAYSAAKDLYATDIKYNSQPADVLEAMYDFIEKLRIDIAGA